MYVKLNRFVFLYLVGCIGAYSVAWSDDKELGAAKCIDAVPSTKECVTSQGARFKRMNDEILGQAGKILLVRFGL